MHRDFQPEASPCPVERTLLARGSVESGVREIELQGGIGLLRGSQSIYTSLGGKPITIRGTPKLAISLANWRAG